MKKKITVFIFLLSVCSFGQTVKWKAEAIGSIAIKPTPHVGQILCSQSGAVYFLVEENFLFTKNNGNSFGVIGFDLFYDFKTAGMCPDGKIIVAGKCLNTQTYTVALFDSTSSIKTITHGLPYIGQLSSDTLNQVITFATDPKNNIYAATSSKVYYLSKNDTAWVERSIGLPDNIRINSAFAKDSNTVFIATSGQGIFRSTNKGSSWTKAHSGIPDSCNFNSFAINSSSHIFVSGDKGIFISRDNGHTWNPVNNGLHSLNIISLAVNKEDRIFAFTKDDWKLYNSTDDGTNWTLVFEQPRVTSPSGYLAINSNGYIFISDFGAILYTVSSTTDLNDNLSDVKLDFSLLQNYPNPFNPATTISYSIPKESFVELKIYDMLGREVSTLVNDQKPAGEHKVQFDGSSLPSGVYVYTLQAGSYRESMKLLLLK